MTAIATSKAYEKKKNKLCKVQNCVSITTCVLIKANTHTLSMVHMLEL